MTLTSIDRKETLRRINRIVRQRAATVRRETLVPFCEKYGLQFKASGEDYWCFRFKPYSYGDWQPLIDWCGRFDIDFKPSKGFEVEYRKVERALEDDLKGLLGHSDIGDLIRTYTPTGRKPRGPRKPPIPF